jgi:hypothetical protein
MSEAFVNTLCAATTSTPPNCGVRAM